MPKRISKSAAIKSINDADALEIVFKQISRNDQSSTKRSQLNRFAHEVQKQIQDERDIILISVKVK